ncbi:hypothetical protein ACF0H5_020550 [Mactra antiquata]
MSHEDECAVLGEANLSQPDINGTSREILSELKGQKNELFSLEEEILDNSLSSELNKLNAESSIRWKFESNRLQYEFNSRLDDNLKQLDWAGKQKTLDYVAELCAETREQIRSRNKMIRLANSNDVGWDTVQEYEANLLASNSEDE